MKTATIYFLDGWGSSSVTCKADNIANACGYLIADHPKAEPLLIKLRHDNGSVFETTVMTFDEVVRKVRNWLAR